MVSIYSSVINDISNSPLEIDWLAAKKKLQAQSQTASSIKSADHELTAASAAKPRGIQQPSFLIYDSALID
jgi:hypothetical protein